MGILCLGPGSLTLGFLFSQVASGRYLKIHKETAKERAFYDLKLYSAHVSCFFPQDQFYVIYKITNISEPPV